jgi:hypothetical protein
MCYAAASGTDCCVDVFTPLAFVITTINAAQINATATTPSFSRALLRSPSVGNVCSTLLSLSVDSNVCSTSSYDVSRSTRSFPVTSEDFKIGESGVLSSLAVRSSLCSILLLGLGCESKECPRSRHPLVDSTRLKLVISKVIPALQKSYRSS